MTFTHALTLEMIGMLPAKPDVTYTHWPVNGTLNQTAFCLARRKLLQICMATSNPSWAAWPCRCLKHQAGERIQPTRLTTAPAAFSYRPTRARVWALTGALFLRISSFKGIGRIPLHVKLFYRDSSPNQNYIFPPWPVARFIHLDFFGASSRGLQISAREVSAFSPIWWD